MDYLEAFEKRLWSETFGICLMYGIDEDVYKANYDAFFYDETYKAIRSKQKQLKADAVAGVIESALAKNGDEYYKPTDLIEWALFHGLPVPDEIRRLHESITETKEILRAEFDKLDSEPLNKKLPIQEQRNQLFIEYFKKMGRPHFDGLTKKQIHEELKLTGRQWSISYDIFEKWWQKQDIYKKT